MQGKFQSCNANTAASASVVSLPNPGYRRLKARTIVGRPPPTQVMWGKRINPSAGAKTCVLLSRAYLVWGPVARLALNNLASFVAGLSAASTLDGFSGIRSASDCLTGL